MCALSLRRKHEVPLLRGKCDIVTSKTCGMTLDNILSAIDAEIARLQQVRALLSSDGTTPPAASVRKRRKLSAAARKKIADAQRKRWAKQKAAANGK